MSDVQFTTQEQVLAFSIEENPLVFAQREERVSVRVVEQPLSFPSVTEQIQFTVGTETATFEVQGVILRGPPGPPGTSEEEMAYAKRTDFATESLIYRGEAAVGSATSASVWRIRRLTLAADDDVTEEWAGGTAEFDKIWDDRASLTYS